MSIANLLIPNDINLFSNSIIINDNTNTTELGYPLSLNGELNAGEDRLIILRSSNGTPEWGIGMNDSNQNLYFHYYL